MALETAAGIVGLIGFGFQLCSQIENIVSCYRSFGLELTAISSDVLTMCDVLEMLDKRLKNKRVLSGVNTRSLTVTTRPGAATASRTRQLGKATDKENTLVRVQEEAVLSESQACLQNVLDKCWVCLLDIQRVLEPFRSGSKGVFVKFKWMRKRSDVQMIMANLESCKSTLSLTLLVMRYCGEDEDQVDPNDIAEAIQKQTEQLKSEKDSNYAFVMQRYLDCASSTIGSPKSTLVQQVDDVKSLLLLDDDASSVQSGDVDSDEEFSIEDEATDPESFRLPTIGSRPNSSRASLLSLGVYQKVGNERKEQKQRKKANRDSGIVMEDDDSSTFSRQSNKWLPFVKLTYKLDWYRRNFRPDINGRLTGIKQMADTCEFNIEELLLACKDYSRPCTPSKTPTGPQLRKKRSRDRSLPRQTLLAIPDEDYFRTIVRIRKALANLANLRENALEILSTPPILVRSSSHATTSTIQTPSTRSNTENPLRPYVLDAVGMLITIHLLTERLHQRIQELSTQRDQASKSAILTRLHRAGDDARYEHTKRTFLNIEANIAFKNAEERYSRAEELWKSVHSTISSALEAEFFFFDDLDRILSAAVEEPVEQFNTLTRKNSIESEILDSDVNRAYSALIGSSERQRGYTLLDHRLRGILMNAKSLLVVAKGRIDFIPGQGRNLEEFLKELEETEEKEEEKLEAVFKYLNEYVNGSIASTMGRLEVGLAKFGERLYVPLKKSEATAATGKKVSI